MREITFMEATREVLAAEMEKNPAIFVVGEGIGKRGGNFNTTVGLYDKYGPERLRDTPIVERGFVGMCCGAAMTGSRPIVDFMFLDFILDAMGEMINQIAKMQYMSSGRLKMPIMLRGCIGVGGAAAQLSPEALKLGTVDRETMVTLFRYVFGAASLGFGCALISLALMKQLPLRGRAIEAAHAVSGE